MRREIAQTILVILTLNLFLASTTIAQAGTVVFVDPSLIQDHDIKPGAPIMKSYPSAYDGTAYVTNPTHAYDRIQTTYATVTPQPGTSTTWYTFNLRTFNSTIIKDYAALDLSVNYSVTCRQGYYRFILYVGSTSATLELMSNVNVTTPTVKTWTGLIEPNDGFWNQTDINNMTLRVEVRRSSSTGWCTFLEYEAWASIPIDSFTIKANVSDVTSLFTWQVNMTFNPAVLQAVTAWEGPFLKQVTPPGTTFLAPAIDNAAGWIQIGAALKSYAYGGATGSGLLATICFKATAEGNSVLDADTKLRTWNGTTLVPIDHTTESGFFQYLKGDANNDGDVNSADLTTFNQAYGSTPSSINWNTYCDFDRDNKVMVSDLYALGKNYGQT
jgi:hypothetical protein